MTSTGRGGLPPSPTEPLIGDAVLANWLTPSAETGKLEGRDTSLGENKTTYPNSPPQIVEASGWIVDTNKDLVLVSKAAPTAIPHSPAYKSTSCKAS